MATTTEELLAELLETAREQLRWTRAAAVPSLRETIEQTLTTTQQRRAYNMCDGTTTGQAIAEAVEASTGSISGWTKRWRELGIAYEVEGRRTRHIASLDALGIPVEAGSGD